MRKQNELAHALTELPDELLLEAENAGRRRKPGKLRRIAAAAAIVALLATTVGAAAMGITWSTRQTQYEVTGLSQSYYKEDDGILEGEGTDYQAPLKRVELSRETLRRLEDMLWRYWQLSQTEVYAQTHDILPQADFVYRSDDLDSHMEMYLERYNPTQSVGPSYTSLEQIEELLGIPLDVSPELREAARNTKCGINLWIYTGLTVEQAAQGIETKQFPEPISITLQFDLRGYAGNGEVSCSIVLPLTEDRAQKGLTGSYYSYGKEGSIWQSTELCGSREVCFFGNDPELGYKGSCEAVYITDRGGYILSATIESPDPGRSFPKPTFDTAKDILLSLMEEQP